MKRIMITACALVAAAMSFAQGNVKVEAFDNVSVNIPARVRFVQGDSYSVSVRSANKYDSRSVRMSVRDGVLFISGVGETDGEGMCITIVSPTLPGLSLGRGVEVK